MTAASRHRLLLLAAAVLFSTGGAAIKAVALTGWQVACFRSGIAAAALAVLIPSARRRWNWRVLAVAVAYAATMVGFVLANRLTTAANAIFLQDTAPLYLLLIGPLLLREPVYRGDLVLVAAVAAGMLLFFAGPQPATAIAPDPARGNLIAALTGVTWAFTIAGLRWLGRHGMEPGGAIATVAAGNLLACLATLPMAVPVIRAGWADAAVVVYLGVFQIGLAYVCLTRALRHVPAFESATLLLAEPALNPVWAWLVHGERPGVWAIGGGVLILGATFANAWRQSLRDKPVHNPAFARRGAPERS